MQKPEKRIERLIKASSIEGDLVLDAFSGTGTVAAVCRRLKRVFIAFEIDPSLAAIARRRLRALESLDCTV
jgi:DNA modification methylase